MNVTPSTDRPTAPLAPPTTPLHDVADLTNVLLGSVAYPNHGYLASRVELVATGELVGDVAGYRFSHDARAAAAALTAGSAVAGAAIVQIGERFFGVGLEAYDHRLLHARNGETYEFHSYKPALLEGFAPAPYGLVRSTYAPFTDIADGEVELAVNGS